MALMSDPIPVASATPFRCQFNNYMASVNVVVLFYTDAEGTTPLTPQAGSRDVTATYTLSGFAGRPNAPTAIQRSNESAILNGTLTLAAGVTDELLLGSGLGNVILSAAANTTPGTAVSYRMFVDVDGQSSTD